MNVKKITLLMLSAVMAFHSPDAQKRIPEKNRRSLMNL